MIHLKNIRVDVAGRGATRTILSVEDFRVRPGESVALVGPSGCGKTTLLSLIAGLRAPTQGTVEVCGRDLGTLRGYSLDLYRAAHVSVVFQAFNLLENSPARRNVTLPLALTGRRGPAADAWVDALLARVGLGDRATALPRHLSAGERQRLAVARALAGGAPVLLADEPTGNLDSENVAAVLSLLKGHAGPGHALVVASHDRDIQGAFDRVVDVRDLA